MPLEELMRRYGGGGAAALAKYFLLVWAVALGALVGEALELGLVQRIVVRRRDVASKDHLVIPEEGVARGRAAAPRAAALASRRTAAAGRVPLGFLHSEQ